MMPAPLARITITLPPDLQEAADRRARALDRSRSWLLSEALRLYLAQAEERPAAVREPAARYEAHAQMGLGESRLRQLEADLALTPEERVREAEATARVAEHVRSRPKVDRVLCFDRYEDYMQWERAEDLRG
jgi:predicted transcriptional regulator